VTKSKDVDESIAFLQKRSSPSDMSVDSAISLVGTRDGRPEEWDWELMEAAEVLALEVANLRFEKECAKNGL
jgi:hypothetical protein